MKKNNMKNLVLTIMFCAVIVFSACGTDTRQLNKEMEECLLPEEQACESDEIISEGEQMKAEEIRRNEIEEQYAMYKPYGMTYDKEKDRFFYKNQVVRYFKDQVNTENTNAFFFEDGTVDVEPMKDTNGQLSGLKQSTDHEYESRTKRQEEIKSELDVSAQIGNSGSFERGNPSDCDDSLAAYLTFGISYDKDSEHWIYDEKPIHILYDADYNTYWDNSAGAGVNLRVIRDKKGHIKKLLEVPAQELEQYVK